MADLVKDLIRSEVKSLVCDEHPDQNSHNLKQDDQDNDEIPHFDRRFINLLKREGAETRDR